MINFLSIENNNKLPTINNIVEKRSQWFFEYTPDATGLNFLFGCNLSESKSTKSLNIYVEETHKEKLKKILKIITTEW